ncbi:MAG TPA: hypothetical protein VIQ02_17055, partial [Jiangellaceae bacterium]
MDELDRFTADWWSEILLDKPLRIAGLLVLALLARYLAHRLIDRLVTRAAQAEVPDQLLGSKRAARVVLGSSGVYSERRALRAA